MIMFFMKGKRSCPRMKEVNSTGPYMYLELRVGSLNDGGEVPCTT